MEVLWSAKLAREWVATRTGDAGSRAPVRDSDLDTAAAAKVLAAVARLVDEAGAGAEAAEDLEVLECRLECGLYDGRDAFVADVRESGARVLEALLVRQTRATDDEALPPAEFSLRYHRHRLFFLQVEQALPLVLEACGMGHGAAEAEAEAPVTPPAKRARVDGDGVRAAAALPVAALGVAAEGGARTVDQGVLRVVDALLLADDEGLFSGRLLPLRAGGRRPRVPRAALHDVRLDTLRQRVVDGAAPTPRELETYVRRVCLSRRLVAAASGDAADARRVARAADSVLGRTLPALLRAQFPGFRPVGALLAALRRRAERGADGGDGSGGGGGGCPAAAAYERVLGDAQGLLVRRGGGGAEHLRGLRRLRLKVAYGAFASGAQFAAEVREAVAAWHADAAARRDAAEEGALADVLLHLPAVFAARGMPAC